MSDADGRSRPGWGSVLLAFLMGASLGAYSISLSARPAPNDPPPFHAESASEDRTGRASDLSEAPKQVKPAESRLVDPRRRGFELGLGEWALTPEADAIRPGKVTFVISNRGTMAHGFEIELEGESSGSGSGSLFKSESRLLQPGESTRMTVSLRPAVYKIECLVDGHDDMGMEGMLVVRRDAPFVRSEPKAAADAVAITGFAFSPATVEVDAGTEVTWSNEDPADHTVTAFDGDFGSDALTGGDSFRHRFAEPGVYRYRCAIHPEMEGSVKVR